MTSLQLDVGISDPFAAPIDETNVTEITKSYPTPNDDHVSALKADPDTINYFDDKFGVGSGVKYLGEVDRAEIPEPPREITMSHVLDVMQGKPSPFEQTWSVIADDEAIKRQKRDVAVIQSMTRAKAYPDRLSSDWVDKEVSNATANYLIMRERAGKEPAKGAKDALDAAEGRYAVARDLQTRVPGWMEKQVNDAKARYEKSTNALKKAYESGIVPSSVETEAKVALSIASMADKVAEDRKTGFERRLGPRERLIIAEKVATAEAEVQYRQDLVDAAKRTPGDDVARAEADLVEARKQAKALQDIRDYGEERRPMDDASFHGEALRGLARALTVMPLTDTGANIGLIGRYFGSETLSEVGSEMAKYGASLGRDFAARANPSVLELDPSSPTFGGDLKRWLGGALGEAVGSTVPIVAGFMAGGPWTVAGVGYGFNLNWGEMTNSLDEAFARQGITPDPAKQMAYVATYGTAIGALDNISAIFLVPGMSALVKREAVQAANASMARAFVSGIARGAAMEGLTEGMQQGLEEIGTAFATDQGIDWKEFSKRVIEATAAGAVGGAGFGVMGAPHEISASRDQARQAEMQKLIRETVGELKIETEKKAEAEAKKPAGGRKEAPIEGKAKVPVADSEAVSLPGEPSNVSVKATQDQISTDVAEMAASEPMTEAEISRVAEENLPAFHADMVQAFQSEGLEFDLTDGDVRQVARIMAQGVPAEEAIQRHIAGVSQPEATTKEADQVEPQKPVSEAVEAAKQPSEPAAPESTRAMARFNDYLQTGGSLATSAYNEIASYTGIDRKQVGALFQSAEQQGLLKRDRRGRPRRGPALAAASERQEGKAVAATGRSIDPFGAIEASLKQGRTFTVPDRIIDAVHAAQEPMMRAVPENTRVGVLERVEPTDKPNRARYVFRMPDQTNVVVFGRFNEFEGTRAFYLPGRSFRSGNPAILSLTFTGKHGAASPGSFDRRIAGELGHEVVHDLIGQGRLVGNDLFRLIGHAEALKVLDTQLGTHLKMVGDPAYVNAGDYTLREEYTKTYAGRANLEKLLSEESATHLVESYIHFVFDPSVSPYTAQDFAPVQDILDNILSGVYAGNAQPRTAVAEGQAAMKSAAMKGTELPDGTKVKGVPLYAITAYHGSPHEFIAAISGRTGQMPGGQSRVPSPGLNAPAKALDQVVADLNTALGLTTRHGRLNPGLKAQAGKAGGKLRGQHNVATGVTRLAVPLDIDTLSHEGGHALEVRFGSDLRSIIDAHSAELEPLASMGADKLSEGFAEYFRRYVTNPSAAENAAPTFTNAFDDFIDAAEPGLRDALEQVQVGYQEWIDAPSGGVVASTIKSAQKPTLIKQLITRVQERGFKDVAKTYGDRVYTSLIDNLHPIKVAVDRLVSLAEDNIGVALGSGQRIGISAANDAYKLLRLARMGYQGGHVALMEGVKPYHGSEFEGPSWRDAMGTALGGFETEQWSKENMRAFDAYLTSRRMVEEWKRFKAGEITNPPDKLSRADHEQSVRDYEDAYPSFLDGAKLLYDYQHNLLKLARDAGFISDERFQTFSERKGYYVPLNRVMDDDTVGGGVTQDNARKPGTLGKQFRGSTRDIISPTESIAKFTYELHYLISRNDAISALDTLARAAGPGGGAIAERIPGSQMRGTTVDAIEVVRQAAKVQGLEDADLVFMIQAIEEKLGEETTATVFKAGEISAAGEPIIYLWENGKRVAIQLADGDFGREMFDAITGMGKEWQGFWTNFLAMPSTLLRAGVTLDPAFLMSNFLRDQLATWINSEDFTPFVSGISGSIEAVESMAGGRPQNLTLANASGMIMGGEGIAALHEARVKRDVEKLRKKGIRVTEAINPLNRKFWELTGITETGTRVGVFRNARLRALRDGLSEYEATVEAAYAANDIIDFSRHGSKMLVARRLVTFLNAALQGMERSLRTATGRTENPRAVRDLISPYIKSRTGQPLTVLERKRVSVAAKFWAKFMVPMAIVGIAQSLLYGDDDEYQEIPEYFRNTHWVFKVADGSWIRIPKPFELGAASLIAERAFESAYKGDEKALERLRGGLFDLVTPPTAVPGLWTVAELWANKSMFTGQQIVPEHLVGLGGELEATAYTSEFSKTLAQWTGVSAAKLDHAILGVSGGLGRMALDASNQALPAIGQGLQGVGMPTMGLPTRNRTALRQGDIPFVKRFTLDPVKSSQSKREFYDRMAFKGGEMTRAADRYKELWDRGQILEAQNALDRGTENEKIYALLENHGTAAEKRMHPMNRARDVISVTRGILTELSTGELKKADRTEYSPTERRSIQEMMEMIQMREARNAMIVIREPGYSHLKILDVESVMREVETKAPDLFEEFDYRMQKKKIQPFSDVASEWQDMKERVLTPGFATDNPPSRPAGRRSGYDAEASP